MGTALHLMIAPALEAARRALRDLEPDQVPADLRKVARHSGALPPPLATALTKGLDRYPWLREKALDAWPDADPRAAGEIGAAAAFLSREPGWVSRVAAVAAARGAEDALAGAGAAAAAAEDGRHEAKVLKARLGRERESSARHIRELERMVDEERKLRRIAQAGSARRDQGVQEEIDDLRSEVARTRDEIAGAAETIASLQEQLRSERRARSAAEAAAAEATTAGGWSAVEAEELAIRLDEIAGLARPHAAPAAPVSGAAAASTAFPAGTRPDRAGAIEWLLNDAPPVTVLIDGYNAAFVMAGPGNPAAARQRLELEASRLVTLASGRLAVIVVYDSARGVGEPPSRRSGVEILFTSGRLADDVIVELAGELDGTRVVISNDRAVRERAEQAGAVALWSDALVMWGRAAR